MRERDLARQAPEQKPTTAQTFQDRLARSTGFQGDDVYSGTAGAFVASLFAIALLAIMFISLSDHFQSHWKAAAVVGAAFMAWLLLAAFVRAGFRKGARRWIYVGLGAAIVALIALFILYYLGAGVLKWFGITVGGFYGLKTIASLLERYCRSTIGKIAVWSGLVVAAVLISYQVRVW